MAQGTAISPPHACGGGGRWRASGHEDAPAGPKACGQCRTQGSLWLAPPWARARLEDRAGPHAGGSPGGAASGLSFGVSCNPVRFTARETIRALFPSLVWAERGLRTPRLDPVGQSGHSSLRGTLGRARGKGQGERSSADPVIGTSSVGPGEESQQRPSDQSLSVSQPHCSRGGGEGLGRAAISGVSRSPHCAIFSAPAAYMCPTLWFALIGAFLQLRARPRMGVDHSEPPESPFTQVPRALRQLHVHQAPWEDGTAGVPPTTGAPRSHPLSRPPPRLHAGVLCGPDRMSLALERCPSVLLSSHGRDLATQKYPQPVRQGVTQAPCSSGLSYPRHAA